MSLFNQGNDASVLNDGYDGTVALVAQRLDPSATISFEVNTDPAAGDGSPGWTAIVSTPTTVGDFVNLNWLPDTALLGREVAIRAVATAPSGATYSTRQGVVIARSEWGTEAINVGRTPFSSGTINFFQQPYADSGRTATRAAVPGLTTASSGTAQVSWWDPATQSLRGKVDAVVRPSELKVGPGTYVSGGGTYDADLDITAFGPTAGDRIALAGELDTDDVSISELAALTIGGMDAYAPDVATGQPTTVTVTVISSGTNSRVPGAEVRRKTDESLVGYTDGRGEVHDIGIDGSLVDYYVNTTDNNAYEAGTDFTDVTAAYAPTASSAAAVRVDGRVFDDDEYAAGDLFIQLLDPFQLALSGGSVQYRVYPTGTTPPATYQTATSDAQGRAAIDFAPAGPDGSYTVDYRLPTASADSTITFAAGDAGLAVTPASGVASPGGQIGVTGVLSVAGLPLSNRRVAATYTRGIELVPGTTADAALVDGAARALSLTATTDPLGVVTYVVADPAESPQGAEPGGKLGLATAAAAAGGVSLTGNPVEAATVTTAFGSQKGKAKIKLKGSSARTKDKLVVKGPDSIAGEKVTFFRVVGGKLKKIKSKKLGKKGDIVLKVKDANGDRTTSYLVKLASSDRVKGSKSKKLKLH